MQNYLGFAGNERDASNLSYSAELESGSFPEIRAAAPEEAEGVENRWACTIRIPCVSTLSARFYLFRYHLQPHRFQVSHHSRKEEVGPVLWSLKLLSGGVAVWVLVVPCTLSRVKAWPPGALFSLLTRNGQPYLSFQAPCTVKILTTHRAWHPEQKQCLYNKAW